MSLDRFTTEWSVFIGNNWDIFASFIPKSPTSASLAKRSFKNFFKNLNNPRYGVKFYEKYIYSWVFIEKNSFRRGCHIHTLVRGIDPALAPQLQEVSRKYFSPWSQVVAYDPAKGARHYLVKKILNRTLEDYDFYKINSRWR